MSLGRWIIALVVVGLVAFATYRGLQPRPTPPLEVTTALVRKGSVTRTVSAAGHLQARQLVKVSSNISGDLLSLAVKDGQRVRKGQLLGQIDRRLQESQVAQFRAGVAAARAASEQVAANIRQLTSDLARTRQLAEQRLASGAELERAQTVLEVEQGHLAAQRQQVAQGEGQLATAVYSLSRSTLVAPMDGTVLELLHKVGERIRGSDFSEDVVLLLGGLDEMEVKAEVGEHEVVAIHEGDAASIDIDALGDQPFKGHVAAVAKNAQIKNQGTDAEVTTFFVRVAFDAPPPDALPGMSAAVAISTATHDDVVMVPIQAVTAREPKKKEPPSPLHDGALPAAPVASGATPKARAVKVVFVVKDGKVEMREVRTGLASRTDIEVLEGLGGGETVVDGPYRTLARELEDGRGVKKQDDAAATSSPGAAHPPG